MGLFERLFGKKRRKPKLPKVDIQKRFDLIFQLGPGSMSKVWKARDRKTGMLVALKILDKEKTAKLEARFRGLNRPSEGEVAVQLHHPNIVKTYEFGLTRQGEQFLVMEFIEGVSLSYLVEVQNEQMQKFRLDYMIQLGEAVAYLHENKWIHRDICPRNVLVNRENQVKLIDFGLVVPNREEFRRPGNRTGTVNYMAPELIKRQWTDHRIDIFSYAVTCYEMCSGHLPWEAVETLEMVLRRINQPPRPLHEVVPDVDPRLEEIIMKGLAINPDQRWQTAAEMTAALRTLKEQLQQSPQGAQKVSASKSSSASKRPSLDAQKSKPEEPKELKKPNKSNKRQEQSEPSTSEAAKKANKQIAAQHDSDRATEGKTTKGKHDPTGQKPASKKDKPRPPDKGSS